MVCRRLVSVSVDEDSVQSITMRLPASFFSSPSRDWRMAGFVDVKGPITARV